VTRSHGCARIGLRSARWLLPWLSVLLVSVSLASATNGAVTGARTPAVGEIAPAGMVEDGDAAPALDVACFSRVAAYTASLADAVRRCSTQAGSASGQ
jgi:hypothetical protein